MSSWDALDESCARLLAMIDEMDEVLARRLKDAERIQELEDKVAALIDEREQLFGRVETERRRADRLESASEEVSERLGTVIDSVRTLIQTN